MNPANYQGMGMPQMGMAMGQSHIGQPQMGQPQMGQPHMGMGPQMGHPQMGQPQMGQPHMAMGQPQMGQPQMGHPQMVQQQMHQMSQPQMVNPTNQQHQILQYLRGTKTPTGWQQTYRIEMRMSFIFQIITQLNLLPTDAPMQPVTIAIEFERKQFEISPDQMTYEGKCREKLQQLTDARQGKQRVHQNQNVQNAQINFGQPHMAGNPMFTPQQQFPQPQAFPQAPQPIQNQNMALQQQHAQQQAEMQMRNGIGGKVPFSNGQPGPNAPQQAPQGNHFQFTHQDQQQIQQIAQNMMNNMTPQDRITLKQTILRLQPQLRQNLTDRGTDLSHYVIKQKATQAFLQQRTRMAAQAGNQGAFPAAGIASQGGPDAQGATPIQVQQTPQFDQPGKMDHIVRQQQDALHHQQEGQVVVPANTGQRAGNSQRPPSRVQKTPQQTQQGAFGTNRPVQPPGQPQQAHPNWNSTQNQTPNLQQQTPQMPPAQNFAQLQGQPPQQNPLQGQTGGLNNALRTPQQNTRMPTLNQPMNPPNQSQHVSSPNPSQQTPNPNSRPMQNPSNGQHKTGPNGQQHPTAALNGPQQPSIPIAMQQHLATLKTDEEKKKFILMMQHRQQLQRQQAATNNLMAQASHGRGQLVQSGPQGQTHASQSTSGLGTQSTSKQNPANAPQAPMIRPNQGSQQPDPQNILRPAQPTLTEMQEQQMDAVSYPDNILNSNSVLARMPGHVKNWGQLKQWVAANGQKLPPDSLQKLKMLQAKHYQMGLQEPRRSLANQAQHGNTAQQPPGPGPAPAAQMFPNGSNQHPVTQAQTAGQVNQMPFPQVQPPTMQEVQRFKASLPNPSVMSDEQIQRTIMNRKIQDLTNAQQNPQTNAAKNQQVMQERYATLIRNQQLQQTRNHSLQTGQMPQQQPSQTPAPPKGAQLAAQQARIQATQARQIQASQTGSKPPQGVKRNSNDDVVEVPDPKLAQHQPPPPPNSAEAGPPVFNGQPRFNADQSASQNRLSAARIAALNPAQRAAYESQRRNTIAQSNQRAVNASLHANVPAQPQTHTNVNNNSQSNDPKAVKIRLLKEEVMRSMPPRQTVVMSPQERLNISKRLVDVKPFLTRIEQSLPVYLVATQNEARIKDIIRTQLLLASQIRDNDQDNTENFTISPDEYRNHVNNLQRYMTEVSHIVQQMQQKASQNKKTQQSQADKTPSKATPQTQQLSAANLQQQQEAFTRRRTADLNKTQATNKTPAAPTTSHVPFPFGSQSPQGVPQIYVPKNNELTRDKLVLPVSKRQKKNLANGTGASPVTAASPPKSESPQAQRIPPQPAIKCNVPDCKHPAFASKDLLQKHTKDIHEVKDEHITDPLDYVLGGLRMALNLDENGHAKLIETKAVSDTLASTAMKVSASSQGAKGVKQEVATPASKTLAGLKTPQTKTSTPTPGRESAQVDQPKITRNPWASTNIPQQWFSEVFRDVADPNRTLSGGFLATWLEAQPHPDISSSDDSPLSTDQNSPHKSDISATDNLDIKILGEDGFLLENWFDVTGDLEALDMAGVVNMEWDPTFAAEPMAKKADAGIPSDEWLKVFAPEKYSEKTRTEKKAVR